ncbi:hypothetical protein HYR69_04470, partial [Candidatus Sumerlaeota bacterium]|nr:hypothetical protein [Candidatus Sumerlaeota bacterium]
MTPVFRWPERSRTENILDSRFGFLDSSPMGKARKSTIHRKTKETDLKVTLNLDGKGSMKGSVGIGFMDHMLDLFARHG